MPSVVDKKMGNKGSKGNNKGGGSNDTKTKNNNSTTGSSNTTKNNNQQQTTVEPNKLTPAAFAEQVPFPTLDEMRKVVEQKILGNEIYRQALQSDRDKFERFRDALCVKDSLIKTYLSTDWAETKRLARDLIVNNEKNQNSGTQSTVTQSHVSQDVGAVRRGGDDDDSSDDELDAMEEERNPEVVNMQNAKIKIKFVVAEVSQTASKKAFRRLISPVISTFDDTFPE